MTDLIPASMLPFLQTLAKAFGGVILIALGLSFGYKFLQASFMGKVTFWGGLDKVHWLFTPITVFVTPLLVHTPPKDNNLIKTKTAAWVHLFWGPIFFLTSLMLMVSGADSLGLPGTQIMNFVLTCGRNDVPPAITFQPPFTYKFPILKKARKTVFKLLTSNIYMDKSQSLNEFERQGEDVSHYGMTLEDPDNDDDKQEVEQERLRQMQLQQQKQKKR